MSLQKLSEIYKSTRKSVVYIGLLVIIFILVILALWYINITFLHIEQQGYNSEIQLTRTCLSQQDLLFLESLNKSYVTDKIEIFNLSNISDNNKYVYFKLSEIDDPNRIILVTFADPNNIVRFSSSHIYENQINQRNLSNLSLQNLSVKTYEKIRLPYLNNYNFENIEGIWHLNVYVFNPQYELTLVASKPIDASIISGNNSNYNSNYNYDSNSNSYSKFVKDIINLIGGIVFFIFSTVFGLFITDVYKEFKVKMKNERMNKKRGYQ